MDISTLLLCVGAGFAGYAVFKLLVWLCRKTIFGIYRAVLWISHDDDRHSAR